jgi:hypothetical protein
MIPVYQTRPQGVKSSGERRLREHDAEERGAIASGDWESMRFVGGSGAGPAKLKSPASLVSDLQSGIPLRVLSRGLAPETRRPVAILVIPREFMRIGSVTFIIGAQIDIPMLFF